MQERGLQLLQEVFDLSRKPEVAIVVNNRPEKKHQSKHRIQAYLDRLQEIILENGNGEKSHNGKKAPSLERLLNFIIKKYVVKAERIPKSYEDPTSVIQAQVNSLRVWVKYLTSQEAYQYYPDWFRYWAFRSVLSMGKYLPNKVDFAVRDEPYKTLSPFPELNQEALSFILGAITARFDSDTQTQLLERLQFSPNASQEQRKKFLDLLELRKPSFRKLYALVLEWIKKKPDEHLLEITDGSWQEYNGEEDAQRLVDAIKGHSTGWCIADIEIAEKYLRSNKLSVFFSYSTSAHSENEIPTIPRVVIVRKATPNGSISEIRGIAKDENLDPFIAPVVRKKVLSRPDKSDEVFSRKLSDIQNLQIVERKIVNEEVLSKDELIFLYEINRPIEGFGYNKDERITNLRHQRNVRHDAPVILGCKPTEIAWENEPISDHTRAYIGPFSLKLLDYPHLEHIYSTFPDCKIISDVALRTISKDELQSRLKENNIDITTGAQKIFNSSHFLPTEAPSSAPGDTIRIIRLRVRHLGFTHPPTTSELFEKAKNLGFKLCPTEVGPLLRLTYLNQPEGDLLKIATEVIKVPYDGQEGVENPIHYNALFQVNNPYGKLVLDSISFYPDGSHTLDDELVWALAS